MLPRSVFKDLFGDGNPQHKSVGEAYQFDYCSPASEEYGKTILELDPDSPQNFVKVNPKTEKSR